MKIIPTAMTVGPVTTLIIQMDQMGEMAGMAGGPETAGMEDQVLLLADAVAMVGVLDLMAAAGATEGMEEQIQMELAGAVGMVGKAKVVAVMVETVGAGITADLVEMEETRQVPMAKLGTGGMGDMRLKVLEGVVVLGEMLLALEVAGVMAEMAGTFMIMVRL